MPSRLALSPVTGEFVVLEGGDDFGVSHLVNELRQGRAAPILRLENVPDDAVSQGDALAAALNSVLERPSFHHGFPYQVQLRAMKKAALPELTLVVTGAEWHLEFLQSLGDAVDERLGVWVLALEAPVGLRAKVVSAGELALSADEARELAPAGMSDEVVRGLHADTGGAFVRFLEGVCERLGLPNLANPFPDAPLCPNRPGLERDPRELVEEYVRTEKWTEALAVAVEYAPERVESLIGPAGMTFQFEGGLRRLAKLLERLPDEYVDRERTLEWTLVAAGASPSPDMARLWERIKRFLEGNAAPNLRARFAGVGPLDRRLINAEQAMEAEQNALTLWQFGRLQSDASLAMMWLRASVEKAEEAGDVAGIVRAADAIASKFNHLGDYLNSLGWSEHGLRMADEFDFMDGMRRLRLLRSKYSALIALGRIEGLREEILETIELFGEEMADEAHGLRNCLAEVLMLEGDTAGALEQARIFYESSPRYMLSSRIVAYVQALINAGEVELAEEVASQSSTLSDSVTTIDPRHQLAIDMVRALRGNVAAEQSLLRLAANESFMFEYRSIAAMYYLALKPEGLHDLPATLRERLAEAPEAFMRMVTGPGERFEHGVTLLQGEPPARLVIEALGRLRVLLDGKEIVISDKRFAPLIAMAMEPEGVTHEQLVDFVSTGDEGIVAGTMRVHLTHLRRFLPGALSSGGLARFEIPYSFDGQRLRDELGKGNVKGALALYKGPLFPGSEANGVVELRDYIDAELRAAVVASGDGEVLYEAATKWGDDLELWELAHEALPDEDPRKAPIRGRMAVLKKEYAPV